MKMLIEFSFWTQNNDVKYIFTLLCNQFPELFRKILQNPNSIPFKQFPFPPTPILAANILLSCLNEFDYSRYLIKVDKRLSLLI